MVLECVCFCSVLRGLGKNGLCFGRVDVQYLLVHGVRELTDKERNPSPLAVPGQVIGKRDKKPVNGINDFYALYSYKVAYGDVRIRPDFVRGVIKNFYVYTGNR